MFKAICLNCMNYSYSDVESTHCCDLSGTPVKREETCDDYVPDSFPDEVNEAEVDQYLEELSLQMELKEELKIKEVAIADLERIIAKII
jgi:hypothetical protein